MGYHEMSKQCYLNGLSRKVETVLLKWVITKGRNSEHQGSRASGSVSKQTNKQTNITWTNLSSLVSALVTHSSVLRLTKKDDVRRVLNSTAS
jgi:hypothetical protein